MDLSSKNPNSPLAYLYIAEETSPPDNVVRNMDVRRVGGTDVVSFESGLQSFEVLNRNQRQYLGSNVMTTLDNDDGIQTMIRGRRWFGEEDHPDSISDAVPLSPKRLRKILPEKRSHAVNAYRKVGNILYGDIESSCNPVGQGFRDEILRGMTAAFSCRGIGSMENMNGKPTVITRKIICYDWVLYPSHPEAEQTSKAVLKHKELPVMESVVTPTTTGRTKYSVDVCIPLTEILANIGNTDPNVEAILESFELDEKNIIGIDTTTDRAVIKDRGTLIYSRLSNDSILNVHKFLSNF